MFCLSKLFLASSHLCFLALSLTPSKSVWQSFLSLFPGMAPIRDSVSHSPNQTGDYTFALFLLVFSAFYSSTHCLTLALYFVINRLGKLSLTWPWQMMHFIHVKYEIERQGEMSEWVRKWVWERVQEETWQANTTSTMESWQTLYVKRGFESERCFEWEWPKAVQPIGQETRQWSQEIVGEETDKK